MRGRVGVGMAALAAGAVLMTAGCGQDAVSFQPAGGSGAPAATTTVTASAPAAAATTDAANGVVVSRNGSLVCVKGPRGGTACTSGSGTVVVDGVTVSNGVIVGGGGNGVVVSTVTPKPTSGQVRISGKVTWSGKATGTCEGAGTGTRTIRADLPSLGKLEVQNVGDGVLKVSLVANGSSFGLNYVGSGGPVQSTGSRTVITDARLGRSGNTVVLNGDFDC